MRHLMRKEITLAASPITWIFLAGALLALLPGYPILLSAYFICFGLFQTFQTGRESNDVLYTVLLPVRKRDAVAAKYGLVVLVQMLGFLLCALITALRMTVLSKAAVYQTNALMNATPLFLAFVLLIFAAFNVLFVGGFYKTAYKFGLPFLWFGIAALVLIFVGEAIHFFPNLHFFNTPAGERIGLQFAILGGSAVFYALLTFLSLRKAQRRFEKIDL